MESLLMWLVRIAIAVGIGLGLFGLFGLIRHLVMYGIDGSASC